MDSISCFVAPLTLLPNRSKTAYRGTNCRNIRNVVSKQHLSSFPYSRKVRTYMETTPQSSSLPESSAASDPPLPKSTESDQLQSDAVALDTLLPKPSEADAGTTRPTNRDVQLRCAKCKTPFAPATFPLSDSLVSQCATCATPLPRRDGYVDLTSTPMRYNTPSPLAPARQTMFQLPQVAFAYERGWRSVFSRAGFPGPPLEVDLALDYLLPADVILDLSCGSGILSRTLAISAPACRVVATDVSHPMLVEAARRAKADVRMPGLEFVRADVLNLPFVDGAFEAIHSGAALHCWPKLQDALKEVKRTLKPGGRFFATTFTKDAYTPNNEIVRRLVQPVAVVNDILFRQPMRFFEEDEMNYLLRVAGFEDIQLERRKSCLIVRCRKGPE